MMLCCDFDCDVLGEISKLFNKREFDLFFVIL